MSTPPLQPKRTQYPFSDYGSQLKYKTKTEINTLQRQWDTFEFVENYDDVILQQIQAGNYSMSFFQFGQLQKTTYTLTDYNAGQALHIQAYSNVPCSTFNSIRNTPFSAAPLGTTLPIETNVSKCVRPTVPLTAEERAKQQEDIAIYTYVSNYNNSHEYKYVFETMDEKLAYYRGEKLTMGLM